jgi:hypothetical protein
MGGPQIIKLGEEHLFQGLRVPIEETTILDLSGLAGASSQLIQTLLPLADKAILAAPSPAVREALSVTGLHRVFTVVNTVEEALHKAKALIAKARHRTSQSQQLERRAQASVERCLEAIERQTSNLDSAD